MITTDNFESVLKAIGFVQNQDVYGCQHYVPDPGKKPKPIQDQVVEACQEIDAEFSRRRMTIDEYREKIKEIFVKLRIVDNLSA